ncbi:MAG: hypothetical protein V3V71_04235, partial [Roseateles sp.]
PAGEQAASVASSVSGAASGPAAPFPVPPAPAVSAPQPLAGAKAPAAASAASRPAVSSAASAPVPPRRDGALRPLPADKGAEPRAMPRSPVFAAPEPVASAPAVPPEKTATLPGAGAAAAAEPEPRSPTEACGRRVLLALAWCIDRQCERPVFQNHPECVKLREIRNSQRSN